ncbi:MAG: hypothetical protein ACXW01_02510, partial [Methylobacter sp.]
YWCRWPDSNNTFISISYYYLDANLMQSQKIIIFHPVLKLQSILPSSIVNTLEHPAGLVQFLIQYRFNS